MLDSFRIIFAKYISLFTLLVVVVVNVLEIYSVFAGLYFWCEFALVVIVGDQMVVPE